MISLLVFILILALIFGVVWYVISLIPLPPPFGRVAQIVVGLIFILVLIGAVFGGVAVPNFGIH